MNEKFSDKIQKYTKTAQEVIQDQILKAALDGMEKGRDEGKEEIDKLKFDLKVIEDVNVKFTLIIQELKEELENVRQRKTRSSKTRGSKTKVANRRRRKTRSNVDANSINE